MPRLLDPPSHGLTFLNKLSDLFIERGALACPMHSQPQALMPLSFETSSDSESVYAVEQVMRFDGTTESR